MHDKPRAEPFDPARKPEQLPATEYAKKDPKISKKKRDGGKGEDPKEPEEEDPKQDPGGKDRKGRKSYIV